MRLSIIIALCILAVSSTAWADGRTVTVEKGDTLTSIAKRNNVKVRDLRRWNALGKKDSLQPGDTLRIGEPAPKAQGAVHKIRKGETLGNIAKREGLEVADILAANPGLTRHRIKAGTEIKLPGKTDIAQKESQKESPQESEPDRPKADKVDARSCPGRIVQIKSHPYYQLRSKVVGWVTQQTYSALKKGFDHVRATHRFAPRVKVLDASLREGGPVTGHLSHQSGHDIDITYYQKRCPASGCPLELVSPSKLDVRRQWTLLSYWIKNRSVDFILVDYDLQKVLYEHAKKRGVSEKRLREWFQYPRPRETPAGMIQHWESHRNHVHVRFKHSSCPSGCCRAVNTATGGTGSTHLR
jgi:LysM repeat protein